MRAARPADASLLYIPATLLLCLSSASLCLVEADSPSAPVNVTVKQLTANSAMVSWDVLDDEVVIGFAISQQKKDVRMLRFIQEVNTSTRSCALWDLEEDTEYIVHVQAISIQGQSPASEPVTFKTPREAEKLASKNKDEVTMKEMGMKSQQLRTGEVLIIVVVLFMWAVLQVEGLSWFSCPSALPTAFQTSPGRLLAGGTAGGAEKWKGVSEADETTAARPGRD
ncbi:fibronectin type III domain-containing protein 5-like [Sarcophilus harrisii]